MYEQLRHLLCHLWLGASLFQAHFSDQLQTPLWSWASLRLLCHWGLWCGPNIVISDACATLSFALFCKFILLTSLKGHVKNTGRGSDRDVYAKTCTKKFTSLFSDARIQLYPYLFLVCCFTLGSCGARALSHHIKHQGHSPKWALEETHTATELYLFPYPRGRWPRVHTQRRKVDTNQTTVASPPERDKLQPEYEYLRG